MKILLNILIPTVIVGIGFGGFFTGKAYGKARTNPLLCKQAVQVTTNWAVPPPQITDMYLTWCTQNFLQGEQRCLYNGPKNSRCAVLTDIVGEKGWTMVMVECSSGRPLGDRD